VGVHARRLFGLGGVLVLPLQDELAELRPLTKGFALARIGIQGLIVAREAADVEAFDELAGIEGPVVHLVLRDHPALLRVGRELIDHAHEAALGRRRWRDRDLWDCDARNFEVGGRQYRAQVDVDAGVPICGRRQRVGLCDEWQQGVAHCLRRIKAIFGVRRQALKQDAVYLRRNVIASVRRRHEIGPGRARSQEFVQDGPDPENIAPRRRGLAALHLGRQAGVIGGMEGFRSSGPEEYLSHPEISDFDSSTARDPNHARAKRAVRPLFVSVGERAA